MSQEVSSSTPSIDFSSIPSSLNGKVLSVQSHVVHGYVGNRAAVFPLQLLGFEVDFINSVQFSNHTGYSKGWKGQTLSGDELAQLFQGLQMNNLEGSYTHLLTGYIGSETFLSNILHIHDSLIERNPKLIYVCDPVMGDAGKLYVPESLIQIYRDQVLKRASVITPNQFEAETLSGKKIETEQDALDVINSFHSEPYNIPVVVLTSVEYNGDKDNLVLYASNRHTNKKYRIKFKRLPGSFTGTGDVVSALFLAFYTIHGDGNFDLALERTLGGIQAIIERTKPSEELALVASRFVILDPPIKYKSEEI